jgi:hypothetical protein
MLDAAQRREVVHRAVDGPRIFPEPERRGAVASAPLRSGLASGRRVRSRQYGRRGAAARPGGASALILG